MRLGATSTRRRDLHRAFVGEMRPNAPCALALLKPYNRPGAAVSSASEMQNQVLAGALCICEVIKIYDAAIRRADQIHSEE
jgi:hypothetical protein